jgi:3-hydroxyisobutyrate dehydrogenase-like beta-hydroxyacid dehydrogenase
MCPKAARSSGAIAAASVAEVAHKCSTVVTMLPSTPHVEGTFNDVAHGLLANGLKGSLYIDCSTIDPNASKALHGPPPRFAGAQSMGP